MLFSCYNVRAVRDTEHAAIAQQVERILGKDEVSSSNLDSSSNKNLSIFGSKGFLFFHQAPKHPHYLLHYLFLIRNCIPARTVCTSLSPSLREVPLPEGEARAVSKLKAER